MKQVLEFLALLMVGDGVLTLADPKRHCMLWEIGPKPCRNFADEFVKHPQMSRWLGLGEVMMGIALAELQKPTKNH
ncbi:MAG TPA: hypothetical protein VGH65_06715 [Verrucomicrobiaceae bacterium]